MNSSVVSSYDNIDEPDCLSKSGMCGKLNDLLNLNTDREVRLFCPLCVSSFSFKFSLFEHLRTFHDNFLTQANNQALRFKECPFCNAKFYGNHLTAKHVLNHHSKVVRGLFVNKNGLKCVFCDEVLNENHEKHIEECHFLQFEENFRKMFLCDASQEMSMSELINSTVEDPETVNWEDVCMNLHSTSKVENFDEASRINCFDFTDLKQQLENIQYVETSPESEKKSILKDIKNKTHNSARRVLRFDLPSDEDKENVIPKKNFNMSKQISLEECKLLSNDTKNFFLKSFEIFSEEPQHSSTPNNKISVRHYKSKFKSYITEKKLNQFEFQCGKCSLLFKENMELVSHVKNNHKKFSLNAFQPRYHCAICNAKFYKNRYLRKHHNLHKPY